MINVLIIISAVLLIVSKFLDCYTTHRGIKNTGREKNRIARYFMKRFGLGTTIWSIFGFTVVLAIYLMFECIQSESTLYRSGFIFLSLFISIIQFSIAYTNHTGNMTKITTFVANYFPGIDRGLTKDKGGIR